MRDRSDWSKEHRQKVDAAIRKHKNKTLTKDEVLWLFALKDGCEKYHYNLHYGLYEESYPSEGTIVEILMWFFQKNELWNRAIWLLWSNKYMYQAMRKKSEMSLHEWLYLAMRDFAIHLDVYWFYERVGEDWEDWVDEARKQWNDLENLEKLADNFEEYKDYVLKYKKEFNV